MYQQQPPTFVNDAVYVDKKSSKQEEKKSAKCRGNNPRTYVQ
jgi:hypothetical protein